MRTVEPLRPKNLLCLGEGQVRLCPSEAVNCPTHLRPKAPKAVVSSNHETLEMVLYSPLTPLLSGQMTGSPIWGRAQEGQGVKHKDIMFL